MTNPRHDAREAALQILYFSEVGGATADSAIASFFEEHSPDAVPAVVAFASDLSRGASAEAVELDALIGRHSAHWRVERLAVVDRLTLRLAAWELRHVPDTPAAVVLDEAIELARRFGSEDSPRFVNGVLDAIRKDLGR